MIRGLLIRQEGRSDLRPC
jgi:hypothetical protein